jgi:D-amino-acid oxidase
MSPFTFTPTSDQTLQPYLVQAGGNLTLEYRPPSSPSRSRNKRVLIIGGGVSGLTTAWVLLDAGFDVVVLAERWAPAAPRITSQIAGAL